MTYAPSTSRDHSLPTIQGDRLNQSIDEMAQIGQLADGGVCRPAFSAEDQKARALVRGWMQELDMTIVTDPAGNLIGTYPGQYPDAPAFATGSHIDTVPTGGRYDGSLGVLAGIEIVRTMKDQQMHLKHPFQVIVFADEENTMIGSKGIAGRVNSETGSYVAPDGRSIQTCLQSVGGNWDQIGAAQQSRETLAAFVELHVEQGRVLEHHGFDVGVVEGVVSLNRMVVKITGSPNHAGTTPMSMRQDALVAAAHIIMTVNELASQTPGDQVATVGSLKLWPNAANVVPGYVELTIDLRDLSQEKIAYFKAQFKQRFKEIAAQTQTHIEQEQILAAEPTLSHPGILDVIRGVAHQLDLTHHTMPSRAGHDAQEVGKVTDMAMIFVPSSGGVSHSEEEYTSPAQCTYGANVLFHTFLRLDDAYPV